MAQAKPDPYLVLLRRELIRAQARLRRCERERDDLRAALKKLKEKRSRAGSVVISGISKPSPR